MNYIKKLIILALLLNSCSGVEKEKATIIQQDDLESEMIVTYKEGVQALKEGDVLYAAKKFNESELLYPQSSWAPKSSLMASYAYYRYGYYSDSIYELKRFIKLYSKNENLDYAYYLLAMNYYDSIVNEKKDLRPLLEAKKNFEFIIDKYPNTDFSLDAKYKLELIHDTLAAKEMYIARHYIKKEKWIAAINRFKKVINDYKNVLVMRSFSKAFGLAGIRLGYLIGNSDIINYVSKTRTGYESNSISIGIASFFIDNYTIVLDYIQEVKEGLDFLKRELDTIGIENNGSNTGNNIFINLKDAALVNYMVKSLSQKNIYVRGDWPSPYNCGISVTGGPKYLIIQFIFFIFFRIVVIFCAERYCAIITIFRIFSIIPI